MYCRYEEARKVKGIKIDRRNVTKPEDLLIYKGNPEKAYKDWYGFGKNHRIVNNMIERDFDDEFYVIEMNTLEDLLDFQEKYDINATVKKEKRGIVYDGEELYELYADFMMTG